MHTIQQVKLGAALFVGTIALSLGPSALSQEGKTGSSEFAIEDEALFEAGGSCAALAYLGAGQLRALIAAGYADDLHSFCFPEEPSECSDYTAYLKGMGRLSTGEDGFHCSLQLQP